MRPARTLMNKYGMTLVEVLVAVAIFTFCVCGLLLTYMNLFIFNDAARDSTLANHALIAKLEEIRSTGYSDIPAWDNKTFNAAGDPVSNCSLSDIFCGRVCVSSVRDPFNNTTFYNGTDLKRVRVIISFYSRNRLIGNSSSCGEDLSGKSQLRSPVEGVIMIKNFTRSDG